MVEVNTLKRCKPRAKRFALAQTTCHGKEVATVQPSAFFQVNQVEGMA
jgi:hypothetical protein